MRDSVGAVLFALAAAYWYVRLGAPPRFDPYIVLFALGAYWYLYVCVVWDSVPTPTWLAPHPHAGGGSR